MQNSPNTAVLSGQLPSIPLPTMSPIVSGFGIPGPGFMSMPSVVPPAQTASLTGSGGIATMLAEWTEHKAPDGRTYYYNAITKQSSWTKPDQLKSEAEILLSSCPWKEYTSENGKIYYHNVETKESRWTIPVEMELLRMKVKGEEK